MVDREEYFMSKSISSTLYHCKQPDLSILVIITIQNVGEPIDRVGLEVGPQFLDYDD